MMRILFTSTSGSGHIHALIPLAQELIGAGHELRFATAAASTAIVEAVGIQSIPAGRSWPEWRETEHYPDLAAFPNLNDWLVAFQTKTVRGVAAKTFAADLIPALQTWKPDVIVRDSMEFGGYLAGELLAIPHAVGSFIWFYPEELRVHYDAALNQLRADNGLPSIDDRIAPYPYLALPGMPRSWVADDEWVPPTAHFQRPVPFNQWQSDPLPDWFDDLPDRPIIHAAFGSTDAFGNPSDIFAAIVHALRDAQVTLVLARGRHTMSQELATLPENVFLETFYPYNKLLPLCSVFITHAGYGSTMASLSIGLPMVVIPLGADQFRNGKRIVDLGVGVMLDRDKRTPDDIRQAVFEVLYNPVYRERAGQLQQEITALPSPDHAVRLLERLGREKQPLIDPRVDSA